MLLLPPPPIPPPTMQPPFGDGGVILIIASPTPPPLDWENGTGRAGETSEYMYKTMCQDFKLAQRYDVEYSKHLPLSVYVGDVSYSNTSVQVRSRVAMERGPAPAP